MKNTSGQSTDLKTLLNAKAITNLKLKYD